MAHQQPDPFKDPFQALLRMSMTLFGIVLMLNLIVRFIQPILPWIICGTIVAAIGWCSYVIVRWRRSRW